MLPWTLGPRRGMYFSFPVIFILHRLVHIVMPRLKISSRINLRNLFPVLGIENLLTPKADLLGITKDHLPAILEVSGAISRVWASVH